MPAFAGMPAVAVEGDAMSIVSSAAADGFIQRLPKEICFYLVHGLDEGLTHERVKAIVRSRIGDDTDPMRLVRFEGDAVARDPGALADEAYAISMFGGDRVIWIDAQGRDLLPALEPLFARPPTDCTIVVKAGQLKKGTGLRGAFESSAGASVDRVLFRQFEHPRIPHRCGSPRRRVSPSRRMRAQRSSIWSAPTAERRAERSRN